MITSLKYFFGGALLLLAGAFVSFALFSHERPAGAAIYQGTVFTAATTSTAFSVNGGGSTRVLATSTNPIDPANSYTRVWATFCNPSATLVSLNLNADKPVTASSTTVVIGAAAGYNACFEITDRNLYQGSVQASSTAIASVTLFVTSVVQQ